MDVTTPLLGCAVIFVVAITVCVLVSIHYIYIYNIMSTENHDSVCLYTLLACTNIILVHCVLSNFICMYIYFNINVYYTCAVLRWTLYYHRVHVRG